MIDYFIDLFTKPNYQWNFLDGLAMAGLLIGIAVIIGAIWFGIWFVRELIKERKYKTCEQWRLGNYCWHHQDCLNCCYYKKKQLTHQHEDKGESVKLKIEIYQYHNIVDTYESDNIEEILNWFRKHWRCCYNDGGCDFEIYKNNKKLSFFELNELGFEY